MISKRRKLPQRACGLSGEHHLHRVNPLPEVLASGMFSLEKEESPSTKEGSSHFSALCGYRFFQGSNFLALALSSGTKESHLPPAKTVSVDEPLESQTAQGTV